MAIKMDTGSRRWSVVMVTVLGLLALGCLLIIREHGEGLLDIVIGIGLVVGGYCGFDAIPKAARAKAGLNPETGEKE